MEVIWYQMSEINVRCPEHIVVRVLFSEIFPKLRKSTFCKGYWHPKGPG